MNVLRTEFNTDEPQHGRDAMANVLENFWRQVDIDSNRRGHDLPPPNWQMTSIVNNFNATLWPTLSHIIQTFISIVMLIRSTEIETQRKHKRFFWAQCSVAERQLFRLYMTMPGVPGTTIRMLVNMDMVYSGPWHKSEEIQNVLREEYADLIKRVNVHLEGH